MKDRLLPKQTFYILYKTSNKKIHSKSRIYKLKKIK